MTGSETILVVDDEEAIVQSMAEFLRDFGYRVIAMESSPAALLEFSRAPQEFDLVITDMTMPFLSGIDLAGEMIKLRGDIPIILCTGLGFQDSGDNNAFVGIRKVLNKPMNLMELVSEIRLVLDRP